MAWAEGLYFYFMSSAIHEQVYCADENKLKTHKSIDVYYYIVYSILYNNNIELCLLRCLMTVISYFVYLYIS